MFTEYSLCFCLESFENEKLVLISVLERNQSALERYISSNFITVQLISAYQNKSNECSGKVKVKDSLDCTNIYLKIPKLFEDPNLFIWITQLLE